MAKDNKHNAAEQKQDAVEALNSHLTAAGQRVAENKKIIYWVLGAIVCAGLFVVAWVWYNANMNREANRALEEAQKVALNDSTAAVAYAKVANDYSSSKAGNIAALQSAYAYYGIKNYQEAIKMLDLFSTKDEVLMSNSLVLSGDCYVNLKQYDKALAQYQKAISSCNANPQIAPRVLLKEVNIYDELKQYDKALTCLKTIKEDYPQFRLGGNVSIEAYIAREEARLGK